MARSRVCGISTPAPRLTRAAALLLAVLASALVAVPAWLVPVLAALIWR